MFAVLGFFGGTTGSAMISIPSMIAVPEGLLRKSFLKNGEYLDQMLWTILDEDWSAKAVWESMEGTIH